MGGYLIKIQNVELQDRDFDIFRLLREHRTLNNVQIQKAFWGGKNIRAVNFRLKKLAGLGLIRKVSIKSLQPSNYYFLTRKGFNLPPVQDDTMDDERWYEPENMNISGFFQKRTIVADIRIAIHLQYIFIFDSWIPDFVLRSKRTDYGIRSHDPQTVASIIPDGLMTFCPPNELPNFPKSLVLKYHHFAAKREQFTKRFRLFEESWSKHNKLIMAYDEANLVILRKWYQEDLRKYYAIDINRELITWKGISAKYLFADYQSLIKTGKLHVWQMDHEGSKSIVDIFR